MDDYEEYYEYINSFIFRILYAHNRVIKQHMELNKQQYILRNGIQVEMIHVNDWLQN